MTHYAKNALPLPVGKLPSPIFDDEPGYVELYWKAWQYAWDHVITNPDFPHSPYLDEAFQADLIWVWDSCFMVLFSRYASDTFPATNTLDNFYALMLKGQKAPLKIHHPDNPPLFAWAERELYKLTGDRERLRRILVEEKLLQRMFDLFDSFERGTQPEWGNCPIALQKDPEGYRWEGCPNGMDNTPRGDFDYDAIYWLDAMAQQALSALCIAELAAEIDEASLEAEYLEKHRLLIDQLNRLYWDETDGIYYDIYTEQPHAHCRVKTPAAYWPLLAKAASREQAAHLADAATDSEVFGGDVPYPAVARGSQYFEPKGLYMQSAVWLPLVYLATRALDENGFSDTAETNAQKILNHMLETYRTYEPATIWECYAPDFAKPSTKKDNAGASRPDFCGWSALGPISLFIENIIGFHRIDATSRTIHWRLKAGGRRGIERFAFGGITTSLIYQNGEISVESTHPYTLVVNETRYPIESGKQIFAEIHF